MVFDESKMQADRFPEGLPDELFTKLAKEIGCQKQWDIYVDYVPARPLDDKDAEHVPTVFEMVDSVCMQNDIFILLSKYYPIAKLFFGYGVID